MAALVAAASLIAGGCAASGWRPAAREPARRFVGSQVRILTDGGWLTLHVLIGVLGAALAGCYLVQHLIFYVAMLLVGDM